MQPLICWADDLLQCVSVLFGCCTVPDSNGCEDGTVELDQHCLQQLSWSLLSALLYSVFSSRMLLWHQDLSCANPMAGPKSICDVFLFFICFLQTMLPILENRLSVRIRSLINTLNSQTPCTLKVRIWPLHCSWSQRFYITWTNYTVAVLMCCIMLHSWYVRLSLKSNVDLSLLVLGTGDY